MFKAPYRKIVFLLLWITALSTILPSPAFAFSGKVVGVCDGDTITVMHDGKGERIRLYGIDCPEKRQAFGQKAKQFTSGLVYGKVVEVEPLDTDQYGRTVGLVNLGKQCVNSEIVKAGLAWVYRKYCKKPFCSEWMKLEEGARNSKAGLWQHERPTPPWEWRRREEEVSGSPWLSKRRAPSSERGDRR